MFTLTVELNNNQTALSLIGDIPGHDHDLRESIKRFVYPLIMDRFLDPERIDTWIGIHLPNETFVVHLRKNNLRMTSHGNGTDSYVEWDTKGVNEVINTIEMRIAAYEARN